jgi:hypothetical protein
MYIAQPKLPDNYEEQSWKGLQRAIHAIYNNEPIKESLEELYRVCRYKNNHEIDLI